MPLDGVPVLIKVQAEIFMSVGQLNPALEQARNMPHDDGSWRQINPYFRVDEPGLLASPGLVTVGIRQNQGFEVSLSFNGGSFVN